MNPIKIEDQVCSLELAKRLKELGVEQDSVWYWVDLNNSGPPSYGLGLSSGLWIFAVLINGHWRHRPQLISKFREQYSAFTVAELGDRIKGHVDIPVWTNKESLKEMAKLGVPDDRAIAILLRDPEGEFYWDDPSKDYKTAQADLKEADARAKIVIELLESTPRSVLDGKVRIITQDEDILEGKMVVRTKNDDSAR